MTSEVEVTSYADLTSFGMTSATLTSVMYKMTTDLIVLFLLLLLQLRLLLLLLPVQLLLVVITSTIPRMHSGTRLAATRLLEARLLATRLELNTSRWRVQVATDRE